MTRLKNASPSSELVSKPLHAPAEVREPESRPEAMIVLIAGVIYGAILGVCIRGDFVTALLCLAIAIGCACLGWFIRGGEMMVASSAGAPSNSASQIGVSSVVAPRDAVRHVLFGKRLKPPEREISYRRELLRVIGDELNLLTISRADADIAFAHLREEAEPILVLGASVGLALTVQIEPQTGFFVFYEESGRNDCVLITASEERLIDQIVSLASAVVGEFAPRTADAAADVLVGRTIEEVERRLVLRTLLHFKGDRKQAAFALGIEEAALRLKLRRYFRSGSDGSLAEERGQ